MNTRMGRRTAGAATALLVLLSSASSVSSSPLAAAAPAVNPCPSHQMLPVVPGAPRACAHADRAPAGVDPHRPVSTRALTARNGAGDDAVAAAADQGAPAPASVATTSTVPCEGDGTNGYRVQAMYVVAADQVNRYTSVAASIQQWAAGVDDVVNRSAALTGGVRHVRFVTAPNGDGTCSPTVLNVTVPAGANATFDATVAAVNNLGYTSGARKYLMWVDASVLCGVGEMYPYSSAGQDNVNNGSYPQMARIDTGCWGLGQSVEAHELVHTLGAVMPDAPHQTANGHCTDDADRMCYVDGPGVVMQQVCAPANEALLDCNGDDYFSTSPAAGSYLTSHWNAADSRFLIGGGDGSSGGSPGTALGVTAAVNNPALPGIATQASATLQVPAGRTATVSWTSPRSDCVFSAPRAPQTDVTCDASNSSATTVTVTATDSSGATTSRTSDLTFGTETRTASVSLRADSCASFSATVTDLASQAPMKGVSVQLLQTVGSAVSVVGTAMSALGGVARIDGVPLTVGATYSARTVTLPTLPSGSSAAVQPPFPCSTQLTSVVAATAVRYGTKVLVQGRLQSAAGGLAGATVHLLEYTSGGRLSLGAATTQYDGSWSASVTLTRTGGVYAVLPASAAYQAAQSIAHSVTVSLRLVLTPSTTTVLRSRLVTWTARVSPARSMTARLQRLVSGRWVTIATVPVVNGAARITRAAPSTPGTYAYRLSFSGDSLNTAAVSPTRSLKVT